MKKNIIIMLLLLCSVGVASAQTTLKTAYFMDRMTMRHEFNPALMTEYGYLAIPTLGDVNVGINSNVSLDNFLYPLDNGTLATFAHPEVDSADFLAGLNDENIISQELSLAIFSMGFHGFGGYNIFDISMRETMDLNLNKSLFEFLVSDDSSSLNMSGSSLDVSSWTEISFGHSHRIGERLTVGVKLKYLIGVANASLNIDQLSLATSAENLNVALNATSNAAITGMPLVGPLSDITFDSLNLDAGLSKGFGIDFGATYEWNNFTFSAAMTDIGYINWNGASSCTFAAEGNFNGVTDFDFDNFDTQAEDQLNALTEQFEELENSEFMASESFRTTLNSKLNLGAEYQMLNDHISVGMLYTATFGTLRTNEFMGVVTLSPSDWFDFAVSGTASTYGTYCGLALNFCPRWINFFIGTDCMLTKVTPQYVPYSSTNFNLKMGLSIPLGRIHKVN